MRKVWSILSVACLALVFASTAKGADMIEDGKTVKIHYTLTVNGEVADTSEGKDPLEYVQGNRMIIPGLESELAGLKTGDTKKVLVTPENGYGDANPKLIVEIQKENLGTDIAPEVGMILQMTTPDGQNVPGLVQEVREEVVIVNFNHPLAGQTLEFEVEVVDVQ